MTKIFKLKSLQNEKLENNRKEAQKEVKKEGKKKASIKGRKAEVSFRAICSFIYWAVEKNNSFQVDLKQP